MKHRLIGFTGRAHSGKDTAALALIRTGYIRIAFADALKQVTALVANEPLHNFTDNELKEAHSDLLGMSRRSALQKLGKGLRDIIRDDIWVRRALYTWLAAGEPPAVITDVRYENEAKLIRQLGGIVIHINRPGAVGLTGEAAQHESERGLPPELIDVVVVNDSTIEALHARVRTAAIVTGAA